MEDLVVLTVAEESLAPASERLAFAWVLTSMFFVVIVSMIVGGAVVLHRSGSVTIRAIAASLVVAGLALTATITLGMTEAGGLDVAVYRILVGVEVGLLAMIVWAAVLVDCATKEPDQGNNKIVWVVIIVFTHLIGTFLYMVVRRPQRIAETGA